MHGHLNVKYVLCMLRPSIRDWVITSFLSEQCTHSVINSLTVIRKKVKLSCPHQKAYRGSRGIAPLILNISNRWRWVVNFMSHMPCVWDRTSVYLKVWLSPGPIWTFWTKERSLAPSRIQTPDLPAHSPYAVLTMLLWLAMLCVLYITNNCPSSEKIYFCCVVWLRPVILLFGQIICELVNEKTHFVHLEL